MKRLFTKRLVRNASLIFLVLALSVLATAQYYRIWSFRDYHFYIGMHRECHPVCQDLYHQRINPGDDVEEVIASTNPVRVERFENYIRLNYQEGLCFSGVTITAKDGKLVGAAAWSCTWDRTFFDALSQQEWNMFGSAYEIELEKRHAAKRADSK